MKQSDIILVAIIAIIGTGVAAWACTTFLGDPDKASVDFTTIGEISSELGQPDPDIFNINAINPTVEVYVGSCVDEDRDGVLSDAELAACNEVQETK